MNRICSWFFAGLLGAAMPVSLLAVQAEQPDHASGHEHVDEPAHAREHEHQDEHEHEQANEHEHPDKHASEHGHEHGAAHGAEHGEDGVHLTREQREMAGIVSERLQPQAFATVLRAPGEIRLNAYATTRVSPRIAAQVLDRVARLGDRVHNGQALVMLSSVEMAQAQGELLVAEREWQRVSKLGREVVSEQRYTESRIAREQARARVRAYGMTEAEIRELLASGNTELADGRFRLLAPQDGTVIRDDFIVGELIEPGRVLFEISDESVLWVEAHLTPDEAARIQVNAPATVTIHNHQVEGRVVQVHHALDEDTRTLGVRIEIPNPDDRLHPGLFVDVRIEGSVNEAVLAIPAQAVLPGQDGDWVVFIEVEDNVFEPREVRVLRSSDTHTVIEGLVPDVRMVTRGAFFLQSELAKSGFEIHQH